MAFCNVYVIVLSVITHLLISMNFAILTSVVSAGIETRMTAYLKCSLWSSCLCLVSLINTTSSHRVQDHHTTFNSLPSEECLVANLTVLKRDSTYICTVEIKNTCDYTVYYDDKNTLYEVNDTDSVRMSYFFDVNLYGIRLIPIYSYESVEFLFEIENKFNFASLQFVLVKNADDLISACELEATNSSVSTFGDTLNIPCNAIPEKDFVMVSIPYIDLSTGKYLSENCVVFEYY